MIKNSFVVAVFLLNALIVSSVSADPLVRISSEAKIFQFATDPWPPYFLDTNSDVVEQGLGHQLVTELFHKIPEYAPSFPKTPWKRGLIELELGVKDAIALLLNTEERTEYMVFTLPVIKSPSLIFYNKANFVNGFEWNHVDDLSQFKIGVVRGYSYGEMFDRYIETKPDNIFEVTTSKQLFHMLQRKRLDLVPESAAVAYALADEQGWSENLGAAKNIVAMDVFHIGISKKSPHLSILPSLNKAITAMRNSGRIDEIMGNIGSSVAP